MAARCTCRDVEASVRGTFVAIGAFALAPNRCGASTIDQEQMMEHRTFEDLQKLATTLPIHGVMSRRQRLERWATVLEEDPGRPLKLLRQVEYLSPSLRASMRGDASPLAIAFADPVLRQEGLTGDTLGDAESFFSLPRRHAHYLLCDCYFQGSVNAGLVAARVRVIARRPTLAERWDAVCRTVRAWVRPASPVAG